jgi:hypothetical protein
MQQRFDALTPPAPIQVVVVNEIGAEAGTASTLSGRSLPFVQDSAAAHVWMNWGASRYQLWLVDGMGRRVDVVDLSHFSLVDPSNATQMQTRLLTLAGR